MANYTVNVKDGSGQLIPGALLYLLDAPNGNGIMANGNPVTLAGDGSGQYVFSNANATVPVRVSATGYQSTNAVLQPGENNITLSEINLASATITGARTFFNKYKTVLFILLAVALIFAAVKFKILK